MVQSSTRPQSQDPHEGLPIRRTRIAHEPLQVLDRVPPREVADLRLELFNGRRSRVLARGDEGGPH